MTDTDDVRMLTHQYLADWTKMLSGMHRVIMDAVETSDSLDDVEHRLKALLDVVQLRLNMLDHQREKRAAQKE